MNICFGKCLHNPCVAIVRDMSRTFRKGYYGHLTTTLVRAKPIGSGLHPTLKGCQSPTLCSMQIVLYDAR